MVNMSNICEDIVLYFSYYMNSPLYISQGNGFQKFHGSSRNRTVVCRRGAAERRCLRLLCSVDGRLCDTHSSLRPEDGFLPCLIELMPLIEAGDRQTLHRRIEQLFADITEGRADEMCSEVYHGTCYLVYYILHKRRLRVGDFLGRIAPIDRIRSQQELKSWVTSCLNVCMEASQSHADSQYVIICKVKKYIAEHLLKNCTRDEIARSVNLNPAYLSRLFKRETGMSLTDYQIRLRMERAKEMLTAGNISISTVAEKISCYNFSYFSRMFKKYVGVTPTEYRRKMIPASVQGVMPGKFA